MQIFLWRLFCPEVVDADLDCDFRSPKSDSPLYSDLEDDFYCPKSDSLSYSDLDDDFCCFKSDSTPYSDLDNDFHPFKSDFIKIFPQILQKNKKSKYSYSFLNFLSFGDIIKSYKVNQLLKFKGDLQSFMKALLF